jgi:cytochrome P450
MTAPTFADNTGVNDLVWRETARQTHLLMQNWTNKQTKSLADDVGAVTLGVISRAGFGKKVESFHEQSQDIPAGYQISFLTGLEIIGRHILAILVFPTWFLDWTPWAKASLAKRQLERYLRAMIRQENTSTSAADEEESNASLLNSIVAAAREDAKQQAKSDPKNKKKGFTEDEVMGNLFIYLLAGMYVYENPRDPL